MIKDKTSEDIFIETVLQSEMKLKMNVIFLFSFWSNPLLLFIY